MAQVLGYKSRLVMDFESTFGLDPAVPAGLVMPVNTFSLKSKRAKNSAQTITGTRNPVKPFDGNLQDGGEGVVPVDAVCFGYWLKAMFGNPTTTGVGPYVHEFKVGDLMPSQVMEIRYADVSSVIAYAKHNGCKIASFAMTVGGDGELVATIRIEASKETISATVYDATPTTLSLSRFSNYQAVLQEAGAPIQKITEMDFSIDFGLDTELYTIGDGGTRGEIPEGILAVTGNITALFQNTTLLQKAIDSTETSLVLTFTAGTNTLQFAFNELQFERNTPGIEGPKGVKITLPFVAYMDDHASASVVVATLTNSVASYA